jgi:hypothetical protein
VGCARKKRNLLITCFFIVRAPNSYGMPFLVTWAWLGLGYASGGCGSFALLVVGGASAQCCGLEDGTALHHVVPMVREEWEIFQGLRKKLRRSFTFLFQYSFHVGGCLAGPYCDYLL